MSVLDYKRAYNYLLSRYKKAEEYFATHTSEEMDKWLQEFIKILEIMSMIIDSLENRFNIKVTGYEKENGFICNV